MPVRKTAKSLSPHTANTNWRHISVYLPLDVFKTVDELARESRRSLSAQVVFMLEESAREKK